MIFKLLEKAIRQNDMVMLSNNQYQLRIWMRILPVPQYPGKEIISSISFSRNQFTNVTPNTVIIVAGSIIFISYLINHL